MINWNGFSGGAVVFFTLFISVIAEAWILGADDVDTVTGFEISEMGAAVMPAAVEDQQAVVAQILSQLESYKRLHQGSIDRCQSAEMIQGWRECVDKLQIIHWQATRVLGLLKHLDRINQGQTVRGVV